MKIVVYLSVLFFSLSSTPYALAADEGYVYCSRIENNELKSGWVPNENKSDWLKITGNWISSMFKSHIPVEQLKMKCSLIFGDSPFHQIFVTVKNSNLTYQYPILDPETPTPLTETELREHNYKDIFDYNFIRALAYASHYVYRTEKGMQNSDTLINNYDLKYIKERTGFEPISGTKMRTVAANIHSIAFVNKTDKVVIIAYKGTSNNYDFNIDSLLMASNLANFNQLNNAIKEAIISYEKTMKIVNKKYKDYRVVLTGHSLGAYYATIVAVNKNMPARVFSSPATHMNSTQTISEYFNLFSNLPLYNVINFVRYLDPVNAFSGRHAENRIYFRESHSVDILKNHSLIHMINEIFEQEEAPYYLSLQPTYFEKSMEDNSYFGIKKLIDYVGYSPLKLNDENFSYVEDNEFRCLDIISCIKYPCKGRLE